MNVHFNISKDMFKIFFYLILLTNDNGFYEPFLKKNYDASSDKLSFCSFFVKIGFQFNFFVRLI